MLLHFFQAKLKCSDNGNRSSELLLRFKAAESACDVVGSESVLQAFCFPLGPEGVSPKEYMAPEEYMFVLTDGDGKRFQGFCRKVLPPAPRLRSKLRYPHVLCIIAEFPWCNLYFKVLQLAELLLRTNDVHLVEGDPAQLPPASQTCNFLQGLVSQLSTNPGPGQILRVPFPADVNLLGASPPAMRCEGGIELQIPPDCGNGEWNCGISLARLLWHVPVPSMLTLIASVLLERRIVITGSSRDTVSAVVQAVAALLYPFKWHHIFLPVLPKQLKDYLAAPMPFLVGLPAQMLNALKTCCMNEVVLVDLDLGQSDPTPGSLRDDAVHLPWRDKLEAALSAAKAQLKSPTEYESSPLIAGIMQEYLLKLIGGYPNYIHEDAPGPMDVLQRRSSSGFAGPSRGITSMGRRCLGDDTIRGFGYTFEQAAFVAHHRHSDKARRFLSMFRHSQMYEVFVQERLQRAAQRDPEEQDAFELRLEKYHNRRAERHAARTGGAFGLHFPLQRQPQPSVTTKISALLLKKHRNESANELSVLSSWQQKAPMASASMPALGEFMNPASFFDDIPDPEYPEDQLWHSESPGHTRGLRTISAMPALQEMHQLRKELRSHAEPQCSSGSKQGSATLRSELGRSSVPIMAAPASSGNEQLRSADQGRQGGHDNGSRVSAAAGRALSGNLVSVVKALWADKDVRDGGSAQERLGFAHDAAGAASTSAAPVPEMAAAPFQRQRFADGHGMTGLLQHTHAAGGQVSLLEGVLDKLRHPAASSRLQPQAAQQPINVSSSNLPSLPSSQPAEGMPKCLQMDADAKGRAGAAVNVAAWDAFGLQAPPPG